MLQNLGNLTQPDKIRAGPPNCLHSSKPNHSQCSAESCSKMFPIGKGEAEQKFWQTPELIEGLLLYLNPESTLRLAIAHERTRNILQGSRVWNNLIKRSSPLHLRDEFFSIGHFVEILKLMEDSKANMQDLLDAICEANPSDGGDSVQMGCRRHPNSHLISMGGFLLLEKVEAALGTTEQTIESISVGYFFLDGSLLSALASRLSRQQQKPTSVHVEGIVLSSEPREAEGFKVLMQSCPPMTIQLSNVDVEDLGPEGWGLLAEALQSHPGLLETVFIQKDALEDGSKEDLRVLWEALRPNGCVHVQAREENGILEEPLDKEDGEAAWIRLCQIKDLSVEEWVAQVEEVEGGDEEGEVEEEDEEEDMGEEGAEEEVVGGEGYEGDEEDV